MLSVTAVSARNTALAAAYSSTTQKAYVYFYDANLDVQCIEKDKDNWAASPRRIAGAPKVFEASQMTVVHANGFNHLFYIAKDVGTSRIRSFSDFTHIRDNIA